MHSLFASTRWVLIPVAQAQFDGAFSTSCPHGFGHHGQSTAISRGGNSACDAGHAEGAKSKVPQPPKEGRHVVQLSLQHGAVGDVQHGAGKTRL